MKQHPYYKADTMQQAMKQKDLIYEIRNLEVPERLAIITDIWDEIKDSQEFETMSDDDKKILLDRFANYKANPGSAQSWPELRQEIYDGYAEKG